MLSKFKDYIRFELNRAPLTTKAYLNDLTQFCEWLSPQNPEEVDFSSVTANDVRTWLSVLARQGNTPRTLRRKIISLRTFFKWMVKTDRIKTSPLRDITLPKISKPLPEIITHSEIENTLQEIEDNEKMNPVRKALQQLVMEMLYSLGIRRAELVAINDSDISESKAEIKVTGKRAKQRVIPVPQKLLSDISNWQKIRDKNNEIIPAERPLLVWKGKRITTDQIYHLVKDALKNASANKKSPHVLRHSFASGMLNGGADIDAVREFLGHASLATTQIYTHISINEIKKAYSSAHPRASESTDNPTD